MCAAGMVMLGQPFVPGLRFEVCSEGSISVPSFEPDLQQSLRASGAASVYRQSINVNVYY